jgi:hypothetical protein
MNDNKEQKVRKKSPWKIGSRSQIFGLGLKNYNKANSSYRCLNLF